MKQRDWARAAVLALLAVALAIVSSGLGCSSATMLADGVAPCATDADCPVTYHCATDLTCYRDGSNPASDASVDACAHSLCSGACVDTASDRANCGACGKTCATGEVCAQGTCALSCGGGTSLCDGACHDTKSDPKHCGGCGKTCGAGLVCSLGECALACAGGTTNCSGACVNETTDAANCGACGKACASGTTCSAGVCATTCGGDESICQPMPSGFGDAGAEAGAPYCANLSGDHGNCGACGVTCASGLACSGGTCQVSCQANLVDCAGTCVDPLVSRTHCGAAAGCGAGGVGSAGIACASGQVCASGTCQVSCPNTQINCGGICLDALTSRAHCGATAGCGSAGGSAGIACPSGNVCSNGACKVSCPGNQIECGGVCVDPQTSRSNCGATAGCGGAGGSAGTACAVGMVCGNGTCSVSCPGSQVSCGGACVDPFTSRSNCGATGACGVGGGSAGAACSAGNVCANGTCGVSCPGLQINCGGTCADPLTSRTNCGATAGCGAPGGSKGATCTNGNVCANGSCQVSCPGTQINCGGTCIDPDTSRSNCGATAGCSAAGGSAGTACASGSVCASGSCQVSCPGTQLDCGGTCTDPMTSPSHCGATGGCGGAMGGSAGLVCGAGTVCTSGSCEASCSMPLVACSGACVDPRYDPGHCGSCNACPAVPNANNFCFNAACGIASCSANTEDCNGVVADGCEVDKLTNDSNCGACGNACAAGTACSNGTCMPTSYTVGGTLTGITAGTLILRNNGADNLVRTADGGFTFATPVSSGQPYAVTVFQQPTGQFCAVTNGSGVVGAANVTNVAVACVVSVLANGSFESAFSGWTLARAASSASCGGATIVSSGTTLSTGSVVNEAIAGAPLTITFPSTALPRTYTALSAANGTSMAVLFTANCPENTKASQLFTIPSGATSIAFAVQYSSGIALNTGSQHVMVTLLDPNTNALLATLYSVGTGSPQSASMTAVSVNIASLAGRMVRLQLDVQGQSFPLFAAFDAFLVQ